MTLALHGNIRALTLDEARAIYQVDYWTPIAGERLPAGLDLEMHLTHWATTH